MDVRSVVSTRHSLLTSVVFLTIHDTLVTALGPWVFFVSVLCVFFAMVSNAVDTL